MAGFATRYKQFCITDNGENLIILHAIGKEFTSNDSNTLESYLESERLGLCKILDYNDSIIKIRMPRYRRLVENLEDFNIYRFIDLINFLEENKIYHRELCFRNIGIDVDGNYLLFDLASLSDGIDCNKGYYKGAIFDAESKYIHLRDNLKLKEDLNNIDMQGMKLTF